MKNTFFILFLGTIVLSACNMSWKSVEGEGAVVEESRDTHNFDAIELNTSADIYFTQSKSQSIVIETNQNLMEHITTETNGSTLVVGTKKGVSISSEDGISIHISSPDITAFSINGSGSIFSKDVIKTSEMNCEINGSGNISLKKLIADKWIAEINGSGDIDFAGGKSETAEFFINGSGNILASKAKIKNVAIEINGSGDVETFVTDRFDVTISGSGDVHYKGTPALFINIDGSGDVEKL